MCPLSLSVLSGGAGEDRRGPVAPLWMHGLFLEMLVEAEPQLLGKDPAQSLSTASIHVLGRYP